MRQIIDGHWWGIKEIPLGSGFFYVIKNEPEDSKDGCITPETMTKKMSRNEAIMFLEKKFNESRNKN